MRIIAGIKKGMNLYSPETRVSRPITDRVKESLFSVLYSYGLPEDANVADLFAGVGSMGLECLSRGAEAVTFVEQDFSVFSTLKKNIEKTGFGSRCKAVKANAFRFAESIDIESKPYNLVFVDPPYVKSRNVELSSNLGTLLSNISEKISNGALVIVRTSQEIKLLEQYGKLKIDQRRQWGTMAVTLMICEGSNDK